jgi:putative OPT family oligopeptide transporter
VATTNPPSVSELEQVLDVTPPDSSAPGFKPFVPAEESPPEFTIPALVTGTGLGLVFAASSLYLVLKIGMTVSASIPVSVLAITLFRGFSRMFGLRKATILENNITQTSGSAGESIAFGVGVTMPALLLLGFDMSLPRVMLVSILGGILGILAMIPLRRVYIVRMHGRPGQPGTLLYPEGTACAQVLISGEKGGTTGATVFAGFGLAFAHHFATEGMSLLTQTVRVPFTFINKAAVFAQEMASELLGVGYIIGARTSSIMMAGAILGYLVIIPVIYFVGHHAPDAIPPGEKPIAEMSISEIRNNYLLFIGAGTVATAGIISMLRTLPMIVRGVHSSLSGLRGGNGNGAAEAGPVRRTDNDMPMSVVLLGSLGLIAVLAVYLTVEVPPVVALLGAGLVVLFGFLFVTVSARLTGEIGSSSNPISGMTTATLMLTCLIFLSLGMTGSKERVLALTIAAVVCIASSNGGTTAQSLKTGFLVGGTPKKMQYAILIGTLISALVIGGTLMAFNASQRVYSAKPENVPNLTLTPQELGRLSQEETHDGKTYKVFDPRNDEITKPADGFTPREEVKKVKKGRYLVDPDTGRVALYRDDTIMGRLEQDDQGNPVKREFDAPKTQVMGIVINGVLKRDLNWSMVAIGAMIAVMLELCGVSSLAFAVGVYVPIQYSAPIFCGGLVRFGVDRYLARSAAAEAAASDDPEAKARAEIEAIRRSETSPGVLLASGYIAGGSLAGVLIAFLSFSDKIPKKLAQWQYRTVEVGQALPLDKAADLVAQRELGVDRAALSTGTPEGAAELKRLDGYAEEIADLNAEMLGAPKIAVPKGTVLKLPKKETATVPSDVKVGDVTVPSGTKFTVPATFTVPADTTLGAVAKEQLESEDKAAVLYELNKDRLPAPVLPANTELKLPQPVWPAVLVFAGLVAILGYVGIRRQVEA